jgi:hypothetical protein
VPVVFLKAMLYSNMPKLTFEAFYYSVNYAHLFRHCAPFGGRRGARRGVFELVL